MCDRPRLPIDSVHGSIIKILKSIDTAIFIGETGSGKSTQIPQMCLEAGLSKNKLIAVTQPRKVAARALALRVADELRSSVGKLVGFKFRFEDNVGKETKLAYLTDGILLREALHDCFLSKYSVVVVDEAHERSVNTDVLLYILKLAQKQRDTMKLGPLKIFLMSATIQANKFSEYLNQAPVYYIKGRTHSVQLYCANELAASDDDYLYNAVSTVLQLHRTEPLNHGFLVFLTGQEEIDVACKMTNKFLKDVKNKISAVPLYSSVSSLMQAKAFDLVDSNVRKVIYSTNVAETSVTIPGIRIVIDSGKVKQKYFSSGNNIDILKVVNISKAQAIQRAGRAGREAKGKCFRLYSQSDYDKFVESQEPEILRSNLSSILLNLIKMGLTKITNLKLIDLPNAETLNYAITELLQLKAVERNAKNRFHVTSIGLELVKFPIDPMFAKILLSAKRLGCLEEALTVVAFLSSENVFITSNNDFFSRTNSKFGSESESYNGNRGVFDANEGDHIRMLKIYRAFKTQHKSNKNNLKEWCNSNGLHCGRLENVVKIRKQLNEICRDNSYERNSCAADFTPLRKAICQGLFLNACVFDRTSGTYRLERHSTITVKIHPSSCLLRSHVSAFVYTDLVKTTETYARDICLIDVAWITEIRDSLKE